MQGNFIEQERSQLEYLQTELQQQRGMMWLFGEIMKEAVGITSFKQLMSIITDMLMGVMGVTTCYLWIKREDTDQDNYKVYYRSIEQDNYFREIRSSQLPIPIQHITETYTFKKDEITSSLIEEVKIPLSRLAVPLKDFDNDMNFGMLVLEHEEEEFFTENTVAFFQTLTTYIAINAQNSRLLQTMTYQSLIDPLTGIYNRRKLGPTLEKIYDTYKTLTVAIIDTDNFKLINDELGHFVGDDVLKAVAQLAKDVVKEYGGEVVRYGGDEFVVIFPLSLEESIQILEEFRNSVYYIQVTHEIEIPISVTIGVCSTSNLKLPPEDTVKVADNALLRGKSKGKNCIIVAEISDIG